MAGPGAGLRHRPDAVITGLDGPSSFTLIDVKTFDVCAQSHISSHHSSTRRGRTHSAVASLCASSEYGTLPPRMRLVVLALSTHGAFGAPALRFLADLSRRAGTGIPVSLLPCATWAVPRFAPFVRMAVSHAVRRGLAESVLRRWRRVRDPSDLPSAFPSLAPLPGAPPAPPALPMPLPDMPPAHDAPIAAAVAAGLWAP